MSEQNQGKVYLVGAGPGDPELITVKGQRVLRMADVVLYDRLAPEALLAECKPTAEKIYVGKVPKKVMGHRQEQINDLLVSHAKAGKMVVRLKGGDPFIFGRGGEEALACAASGIPFELVPGISSITAVPAYAGVPITHRDYNSMFAVFSGHNDPMTDAEQVDYEVLARVATKGTLVILMGMMYLDGIIQRLLQAGLSPDVLAMTVERGTTEQQRVVEAPVAELAHAVEEAGLGAPATTVIGNVTQLRNQGMRWWLTDR